MHPARNITGDNMLAAGRFRKDFRICFKFSRKTRTENAVHDNVCILNKSYRVRNAVFPNVVNGLLVEFGEHRLRVGRKVFCTVNGNDRHVFARVFQKTRKTKTVPAVIPLTS